MGEGGQARSSGGPPGLRRDLLQPTRMRFLSVGWARKGKNRGLYTQVFFSECTDQVSHSTTKRVNKSLEGRLEDLGKNPFFWKPEGGRSLFSTISPAPLAPSTPSTLFPALPRILI